MIDPPISYHDARDVVIRWVFSISKAGPDKFDITRPKYADDLEKLRSVSKLLDAIIAHRASKEARG